MSFLAGAAWSVAKYNSILDNRIAFLRLNRAPKFWQCAATGAARQMRQCCFKYPRQSDNFIQDTSFIKSLHKVVFEVYLVPPSLGKDIATICRYHWCEWWWVGEQRPIRKSNNWWWSLVVIFIFIFFRLQLAAFWMFNRHAKTYTFLSLVLVKSIQCTFLPLP